MANGTPLSLILAGKAGGGGGGGSDNAVLYTEQSLTDAQKSQARANIGATDALTSIPDDVKQAILNCFSHVAWTDDNGQDYYNDLSAALYLGPLQSISAVFTQGANAVYDTDSLDVLRQYLVVTAHYAVAGDVVVTGYDLSGTLTVGTSTITVSYGGMTDTFEVTVSTHILYSLDNQSFSSETIVTNVKPFETDHDLTIAVDITLTTSPTSGNGSSYRFVAVTTTDGSGYSLTFGKGTSSATSYTLGYMGNNVGNISTASTGRHRFVITRAAGSGNVSLKYRKDTGTASEYTDSGTFAASNKVLCWGQGSSTNMLPTGTINKAYIYDTVLTADQINDFLGL